MLRKMDESAGNVIGFQAIGSFNKANRATLTEEVQLRLMILMGFWWVLSGLAAIFQNELYVVGLRWIWDFDISTWGWIHLIIGIVVLIELRLVMTTADRAIKVRV